MTSQVFNFLWLNLDFPSQREGDRGPVREPLPAQYIKNIRKAGKTYPETEIDLWVDSERLTARQMAYLQHALEAGLPNVHLKDLRSIPAYAHEELYNQPETDPHWRDSGQKSTIWRQVDAAKILVSLQGDFDQVFFADMDHAHLEINAPEVQEMLDKFGIMIGSGSINYCFIENQLWGFKSSRHDFFERYYAIALEDAYKGENAWGTLNKQLRAEFFNEGKMQVRDICLRIGDDGSEAEQSGHVWRNGSGDKDVPSSVSYVSRIRLAAIFNGHSMLAGFIQAFVGEKPKKAADLSTHNPTV